PDENIESLVRINCPAVLYSTAREILRSVMAQGPFPALILPTGTFNKPKLRKKQLKKKSQTKAKTQSRTKS
ncbi:MAG: protein-export chaperone SecB, partial [Candidatus Auribacterota bacterium]|nr:protein-export chaperone SecB [Candidatus Auribacterota bacterium]